MSLIRKEVHTRSRFAIIKGEEYFTKAVKAKITDNGNVFTCKQMQKYLQARRIYIHYTNEFQTLMILPKSN